MEPFLSSNPDFPSEVPAPTVESAPADKPTTEPGQIPKPSTRRDTQRQVARKQALQAPSAPDPILGQAAKILALGVLRAAQSLSLLDVKVSPQER